MRAPLVGFTVSFGLTDLPHDFALLILRHSDN
jgi:hypothetical protein